ncbi:hypothetical protein GQ457_10G014220 [Hibiscus cannabinus]
MQSLESNTDSHFPQSSKFYSFSSVNRLSLYTWLFECNGFWHSLALIIPSLLFVIFLGSQAKNSFRKLSHGRSYIMIAYYTCIWLVSLLNFAWCSLQVCGSFVHLNLIGKIWVIFSWFNLKILLRSTVILLFFLAWKCTPGKEVAWNILSLSTSSGMLFLEISLVAFLLKGNYASGLETLTRTFVVSGLIVGLDLLLKVIYLFKFDVPLFIDNSKHPHQVKWGLWVVHRLVLTSIYGLLLFMYKSKWRERLPARPAFYKYVAIMFILNAVALFACGLIGNGAGFGFRFIVVNLVLFKGFLLKRTEFFFDRLYGAATVCYHAFYLPLLYITFMADFFQQEEDLHLENVYYSEMKDAGFFDPDLE